MLFDSFKSVVLTPVKASPSSPDRASSVPFTAATAAAAAAAAAGTTTTATATTTAAVSVKTAQLSVDLDVADDAKVVDETHNHHTDNDGKDKDKATSNNDKIEKQKRDDNKSNDDSRQHVENDGDDNDDDADADHIHGSPAAVTGDPKPMLHRILLELLLFFSNLPLSLSYSTPNLTLILPTIRYPIIPTPQAMRSLCLIDTPCLPTDTPHPLPPRVPEGGSIHALR